MASGVLLGLTAALCWGVADYCMRGATHAVGSFRTLFFMQLVSLLALVVFVAPWLRPSFAGASPTAIWATAGLSLVIMLGAALLYRAFHIGTLAIVSPIAASFGAIAAGLALLAGERPSALTLVGLALALVGVILSGMAPATPHTSGESGARRRLLGPGVLEAIIATLLFGVAYWALRYVVIEVGSVQVAMIGKAADVIALTLVVLGGWAARRWIPVRAFAQGSVTGASVPLTPRSSVFWLWLIPGALLDVSANLAYNFGVAGALTSVVATLSSLFSAITVLLAAVFLRERLTRVQWAGVALILIGVSLVNF